MRRILPILALAALLPLSACKPTPAPEAAEAGAEDGVIARTTRQAIDKAKEKLASGDVSVGGSRSGKLRVNGFQIGANSERTRHLPPAAITPAGDLLIDGKPVAVDEAQRALLLQHRANILAMAGQGVEVGLKGAALGARAATGAVANVLGGDRKQFEAWIEAEAVKLKDQALELCGRLPAILQSQQALAAAVPEFQPYAVLEQDDVAECAEDMITDRNEVVFSVDSED